MNKSSPVIDLPSDMFGPLTPEEIGAADTQREDDRLDSHDDTWKPILPAPADCPPPHHLQHRKLGQPNVVWSYRSRDAALLFQVVRFNTTDGKAILPLTYGELNGRLDWHWKHPQAPRPLYGLDRLAANPEAAVLVVEGEKTADAAQQIFPDFIVITSSAGSNAASKADWTPLSGRLVTIWPDSDAPGFSYGKDVVKAARGIGAAEIRIVSVPAELPDGWDLADEIPSGWTVTKLRELLEAARPAKSAAQKEAKDSRPPKMHSGTKRFRLVPAGVERFVDDDDGGYWTGFCSPLEVAGFTRNAEGKNWGRLLVVTTPDNQQHEWAMPMELMAGDGSIYRAELLQLGLILSPGKHAREALHEYISTAQPEARICCVSRIGWHDHTFVLPDVTLGDVGTERTLLQHVASTRHAFCVSGTLQEWQERVAQRCVGNSRLVFSVSAAFAAPLLNLVGAESGGFHLRGASSTGKTTALVVAGSVWGGGGLTGYVQQWRATDNGLEVVASHHSDTLLCLDELSQVDAKAAGMIAYMLANGTGKARAGRSGEGRPPAEWRILFLSSGEIGLADKLAEDGRRRRVTAGQQVRVVDVSADAGAGMGLFENLHGVPSADAFARNLKEAASTFYGRAGRAFVERLAAKRDEVIESIAGFTREFVTEHCPTGADGQVSRVAARFALVAAAGELATVFKVLPWPRGEAMAAAGACLRTWVSERGGTGPAEVAAGISQVRHFVELHGESRFASWNAGKDDDRPIFNRAGFRKSDADGNLEYFILPQAWLKEVCAGFDPRAVARALMERNLLLPDLGDGKPQSRHKLPGTSRTIRLYRLAAGILGGDDNA